MCTYSTCDGASCDAQTVLLKEENCGAGTLLKQGNHRSSSPALISLFRKGANTFSTTVCDRCSHDSKLCSLSVPPSVVPRDGDALLLCWRSSLRLMTHALLWSTPAAIFYPMWLSSNTTCRSVSIHHRRSLLTGIERHETFGGIHPTVAIGAHQRTMPRAIRTALSDARLSVNDVDGIAYTRDMKQAHALTPLLTSPLNDSPEFPYLTIIVSGGHTLLLLATSLTKFRILATTADESIGRAFDKVGRILEMQWGTHGPAASLEHFASLALPEEIANAPAFPRPFWKKPAFSYASLHSTVERHVHSLGGVNNLDVSARRGLAHAFQKSAVDQLEDKLSQALLWCANHSVDVRGVVVSGGVAIKQYTGSRRSLAFESNRAQHGIGARGMWRNAGVVDSRHDCWMGVDIRSPLPRRSHDQSRPEISLARSPTPDQNTAEPRRRSSSDATPRQTPAPSPRLFPSSPASAVHDPNKSASSHNQLLHPHSGHTKADSVLSARDHAGSRRQWLLPRI
ncbi:glycoprotease [Salix suchowensis]|nr:glycoprotease [Salix suchowensis]